MADLQTIPQVISIGDATIYRMGNDVSNGALFGARMVNPSTVVLIAYVTDALRWHYASQPADNTLRGVANYDIFLCGIYGAQQRGGSGGGTVIPIQPSTTPLALQFYVTDDTPVKNGDSEVVFLQFIGFELLFNRGNQPQATVSDGSSTYYSWDKFTGTFQCFGAANTGELFALIPYV